MLLHLSMPRLPCPQLNTATNEKQTLESVSFMCVVVVAAAVVSARACEIICSKTHSIQIQSRLVTGPKNSVCRRAFALFSAL